MTKKQAIQLFEEQKVRTVWDDEQEKWYYSIVDVCSVLTDSKDPTAYWRKLKQRLKEEGNETVTNCHASATELSKQRDPKGYKAQQRVAKDGGSVAKAARKQLEGKLGRSVISSAKATGYLLPANDNDEDE